MTSQARGDVSPDEAHGLEPERFRRILGHHLTGACAVTSLVDGRPRGMVVGSLTSVSLSPPLVAFLPGRTSTTWPDIRVSGRFCVSILAQNQHDVCRALAGKGGDEFAGIAMPPSARGLPLIDGAAAWIDCDLDAVHAAGDHDIAVGRVITLDADETATPMIFHRGRCGGFLADDL